MALCRARQFNYNKSREVVQEAVVEQSRFLDKPHLGWLTLFITSGTLLCCALPILLVSLGFGAVVASLNYNIPGLLFLAEHKIWTLSLSALLLVFLAWVIWRPNQYCPTEPQLANACQSAKRWNKRIFWLSVIIWCIGFFASVLLLPLRQLLNV
jgi:magnesium-transporting ATPase (P-type)